jgi:hypothetical protein
LLTAAVVWYGVGAQPQMEATCFARAVEHFSAFFKKVGLKPDCYTFVPVSAAVGHSQPNFVAPP